MAKTTPPRWWNLGRLEDEIRAYRDRRAQEAWDRRREFEFWPGFVVAGLWGEKWADCDRERERIRFERPELWDSSPRIV